MLKCSFAFEVQLALHPNYKVLESSMLPLVRLLHQQHRPPTQASQDEEQKDNDDMEDEPDSIEETAMFKFLSVSAIVKNKISKIMIKCVPRIEESAQDDLIVTEHRRMYGSNWNAERPDNNVERQGIVREELLNWFNEPSALQANDQGSLESVTTFWERQQRIGHYRLLPLASRVAFAMPTSSGQLERDFGVSEMHVTPLRARVKGENVDMSAFINRNRAFVDITQCNPLPDAEVEDLQSAMLEEVDSNFEGPVIYSNE